jgi:hypothetical protein
MQHMPVPAGLAWHDGIIRRAPGPRPVANIRRRA